MGRYGISPSHILSHDHTIYERWKERLGNVPFLANVTTLRSLYAIAIPSVCRLSVCLPQRTTGRTTDYPFTTFRE